MWTRTWTVFANDISLNQPSTKINVSFFMTLFDSSLIHLRSQEMDWTFISKKYIWSYRSPVSGVSGSTSFFCLRSVTYLVNSCQPGVGHQIKACWHYYFDDEYEDVRKLKPYIFLPVLSVPQYQFINCHELSFVATVVSFDCTCQAELNIEIVSLIKYWILIAFGICQERTESGHSGFKIPQEDGQFSFLMTPLFCEWLCLWSSRQNHVAANELCIFYLGQNAFWISFHNRLRRPKERFLNVKRNFFFLF